MLPRPPHSPRDSTPESAAGAGAPSASRASGRNVRRVESTELLGAAAELVIVHGQREYRLRVTSNGKLILTA